MQCLNAATGGIGFRATPLANQMMEEFATVKNPLTVIAIFEGLAKVAGTLDVHQEQISVARA